MEGSAKRTRGKRARTAANNSTRRNISPAKAPNVPAKPSSNSPSARPNGSSIKMVGKPNANAFIIPPPTQKPGADPDKYVFRPRPKYAPANFGNRGRPASKKHGFNNLRSSYWAEKGYKLVPHDREVKEGEKFLYVEEDGRVFPVEVIRVDTLPQFPQYSYLQRLFYIIKGEEVIKDTFAVFNYIRGTHWNFYEKIPPPSIARNATRDPENNDDL